jgi:glutamine synthetase
VTLEELHDAVDADTVDTVLLTIADMDGRLQGKRLTARYFLDEVAEHGAEGCNYLLAVDVDMETVSGYEMSSWDRGYGDFVMKPDFEALRPIPWHEGTVQLMADLEWEDGSEVTPSPRQVLRRQLARLEERGLRAMAGTELEFMLFLNTYEEAWHRAYRGLEPANLYNVDYSMLGTARVEPLIRRIRNSMMGAEMRVEDSKGECNFGQHEINFRYDEALKTADDHLLYKTGAKEIAAQDGKALTFMAKFNEREGNSCHIHCSLAREDGSNAFADDQTLFDRFLAGQLACMRELTLFYAPQVNSYKRFVPGSFAPTAVAWGVDNRTCALRVVGHGGGLRFESRVPGADVNPYLALAAMIAAGLHGVDRELPLEDAIEGSAYEVDKPRVPDTMSEARDLFAASEVAREAFGQDVVDHYLNRARIEIEASNAAVTDWELFRGFERL